MHVMTASTADLGRRRRRSVAAAAGLAALVVLGAVGCSEPDPGARSSSSQASPGSESPTSTPTPSPVASGPPAATARPPFHPEVGQCLDVRKDQRSGPDSIVPCSEEHDDEAYAAFALEGVAYPGALEAERLATEGCQVRLADFIGVPYSESVFEDYPVLPTAETWQADGDRRVTCLVWYPADSVVGSLEGAGR